MLSEETLKNLAALSVEERRLADVFVCNMSSAPDLESFLSVNKPFDDARGLKMMVSLGEALESVRKEGAAAVSAK